MITRKSSQRLKRTIQTLTRFADRLISRIHPPVVAVELQSCQECSFIQTRFPFSEEGIQRLYADYRSESYNAERSRYEPDYAAFADQIGGYTENGNSRVDALTKWLASKIELNGLSFLDYGGADGKYLPNVSQQKFVYEISNIKPVPGVTRISDESALTSYGYVQLAHVLEHVSEPLQMAGRVAQLVQPGGYLLLEVPQDVSTETLRQLQAGKVATTLTIHEHINLYSLQALRGLIQGLGLEIVALEEIPVDTALGHLTFVRGLARRSVN